MSTRILIVTPSGLTRFSITGFGFFISLILALFVTSFVVYHGTRYFMMNNNLSHSQEDLYKLHLSNKQLTMNIKSAIDDIYTFNQYLTLAQRCNDSFNFNEISNAKHSFNGINFAKSILDKESVENVQNTFYDSLAKSDALLSERSNALLKVVSKVQKLSHINLVKNMSQSTINDKVNNLMMLESVVWNLPIGKPLDYKIISSPFGKRRDPQSGARKMHHGIDLIANRSSPIVATAPGIVRHAGRYGGYGNFVQIDHGNKFYTHYAHMKKVLVKKNQRVKRGEIIGIQGSTGKSTGDHLHYEVSMKHHKYSRSHDRLNPYHFIKTNITL